ncbi:Rab1a [Hexamita inflata]|uniref:Rab1a n=1 Tax=Hexamita inflata TaxID=28002 RepID=A0AA86NM58_9EUKA|nr:Rab1a [Hexamita inflata]
MSQIKVVLVGASGAGKTAIIHRFVFGMFYMDNTPTIGASFSQQTVKTSKGQANLEIWDTAGQERYAKLVPVYFRNAQAIVVVFDYHNQQSYENGQKWMRELKEQYGNIPSYFVANKAENESNIISKLQVEDFAKRYNSKAFFTSAKTGLNIADVFQNIGEDIMQKGVATNKNALSLEDDNTSSPKTKGCC